MAAADSNLRTFIAIELPESLQAYVRQRQQELQACLLAQGNQVNARVIRWTPAENVHLTLRFLGDTTPAQRQQLATSLARVVRAHRSFSLHLGGVGCFPDYRQPRIVWIGMGGELAELQQLQKQIERLAQEAGFPGETRPFSSHLTIGRAQRNASRSELQQAGRVLQGCAQAPARNAQEHGFIAERIVHIRSDLRPAAPVYTPLAYFILG
jgi:2'-5' RNA ligase